MNPKVSSLLKTSAVSVVCLFVFAALAGVLVGYLEAKGARLPANLDLWVIAVIAIGVMAGAMTVGSLWMRSIDEAAQEAHKWSWYWGGSAGLCIVGVGVIISQAPQLARLEFSILGRSDPVAYLAAGAFGAVLILTAGYTVAWAWWWLAKGRG